jgi:hypothetical protein
MPNSGLHDLIVSDEPTNDHRLLVCFSSKSTVLAEVDDNENIVNGIRKRD